MRLIITAVLLFVSRSVGFSGGADSQYYKLANDVTVNGTQTLITAQVNGGQWVYLHSTGRFGPSSTGPLAYVYISVDGNRVSNNSTINWAGSTMPEQHSFECVGAANLSGGQHTVRLVAVTSSAVYVGAASNLSIMTIPAARVSPSSLASDSSVISVNTYGIQEGTPLPTVSVLTSSIFSDGLSPIIALASGRSYYAGNGQSNYGDAMWNLSIDGVGEHNDSATWSDNDTCLCAETQSPMYNQGFFSNPAAGTHTISLDATNEPWNVPLNDQVLYRVGATTTLVTLNGGMEVYGKVTPNTQVNTRFPYVCVASSVGWSGCPTTGTDVTLDSATVTIPTGHNGVVFFAANSRVQGDSSDQGGTVSFWITVDGQANLSSYGVQQLGSPDSVSTRTIATSYLATGSAALATGSHTVQLHVKATGSFKHLSLTKDLPLMWFD